ncbi:MAG: hypothetical protein OSB10_10640, partial [Planctomycetota bacterium]|nr:hypothetical protein [Planctomycetota bacterium]
MSHQIYAKFSLLPVGLFALVGFGACQSVGDETSVQDLFQNGSYVEANALAADQAESAPDDERAGSIHEMTQVALHLEEGRQASYQGDLAGALNSFFRADHVVPGHPVVAEWIEKTVSELVIQSMRKASESAALGNLNEATGHYEHALVFDPDHEVAKEGIARMLLLE